MDAFDWSERGNYHLDQGEFPEAEKAYRESLGLDPDSPILWDNLGITLLEQRKLDDAEEAFLKAIHLKGTSLSVSKLNLSIIFRSKGEHDAAEALIRQSIDLSPDDPDIWFELGKTLEDQGKSEEAKDTYIRVCHLASDDAALLNTVGNTLCQLQYYEESEKAYLDSINLDPNNPDVWNNLALLFEDQHKVDEAEKAYWKAIQLDESSAAPSYYNLGRMLSYLGQCERAEKLLEKSIQLDPSDPYAHMELGQAHYRLGKYEAAAIAYSKAIEIDSTQSDWWYYLGNSLHQNGDLYGAQEALEKAIELDDSHSLAINALGTVFGDLGYLDRSEQAFVKSIKLNPTNQFYRYHLGIILDDAGKHIQSEKAYLEAIQIDDTYPLVWNNLGAVQSKLGKYSESEHSFKQSTLLDPGDPIAWVNLALSRERQNKHQEVEETATRALKKRPDPELAVICWYLIANSRWHQQKEHSDVLYAYQRMSKYIEVSRSQQTHWNKRLDTFKKPSASLGEAAIFSYGAALTFKDDAIRFIVQSKARTLGELLDHDTQQLKTILSEDEIERLDALSQALESLDMERYSWDTDPSINYPVQFPPEKSRHVTVNPDWADKKLILDQERVIFFRQLISGKPEIEPFLLGPAARKFTFSVAKLSRVLIPHQAVLELLLGDGDPAVLMGFLISTDGISKSQCWEIEGSLNPDQHISLTQWQEQVKSILHIGSTQRAVDIAKDLTQEILEDWGKLLYGPFMDELRDIHTLWVSPHSFLTQLPFNAIPFPDGIERQVAVIPSAASLTQPKRNNPKPKPRFTLGVVAADPVEHAPLSIQQEEVRLLRSTVSSPKRRWELAGQRPGEEPTLSNLRDRVGLTRCLVLSCHGEGPNQDWGTLFLGSKDNPQPVSGRQLVDSFLLDGRLQGMQVDLVVTSACLTGQVDLERPEEWLGLPLALQSIWKTKSMLLTLWEVAELPAMIWVVELMRALTSGIPVGEAHRIAVSKLKSVTREQVEILWLAEARNRLNPDQWLKVERDWQNISSTPNNLPFSDPVHWAPFILVGDPSTTISPRRKPTS